MFQKFLITLLCVLFFSCNGCATKNVHEKDVHFGQVATGEELYERVLAHLNENKDLPVAVSPYVVIVSEEYPDELWLQLEAEAKLRNEMYVTFKKSEDTTDSLNKKGGWFIFQLI